MPSHPGVFQEPFGIRRVTATLADGFFAWHAGNLRGGRMEGRNLPALVNGEDTVHDRVEDYVLCLLLGHLADGVCP